MTLDEILELVGPLDDAPGDNTARGRFRAHLKKSVTTPGALRDYVETCLREPSPQHARALQDLVNHCGRRLGFEVEFGRYHGVVNDTGHDGLWKSPSTGFAIVPEIKTTDAYTVKTSTILGYVDELISEKKIPDWDHALGLYVVGRVDAKLSQMNSAIVVERRLHQLRIASIEALLTLAEMMERFDVSHDEVLAVLRPGGPLVDDQAGLLARIASQREDTPESSDSAAATPQIAPQEQSSRGHTPEGTQSRTGAQLHFLTPVTDEPDAPAEKTIRSLLDQKVYVFGDRTPGRKSLKAGDRIAFYQTQVGVVAEATVAGSPERRSVKFAKDPERFPWAFKVKDVRYFFDKPMVIDASLRSRLDAFRGRDSSKAWGFFVQVTRIVTPADFERLVGRDASAR
jgi:hypothetical protein